MLSWCFSLELAPFVSRILDIVKQSVPEVEGPIGGEAEEEEATEGVGEDGRRRKRWKKVEEVGEGTVNGKGREETVKAIELLCRGQLGRDAAIRTDPGLRPFQGRPHE